MPLTLRTIEFNHDPNSATTSAMNIRRNKDFEVPLPEYDSAVPRASAESCAAYSIADTARQQVFVRVSFEIPVATVSGTYEVRAKGGGIMGELAPTPVVFAPGSATCTVAIALPSRSFVAVGRHDISWRWQIKAEYEAGATWKDLVTTEHRIYLVLALPGSPWTQTFADKRNPWTDLLDECCIKAAKARTSVDAARKLVAAVNRGYALRYDIEAGGPPRYRFTQSSPFDLTNWIDYVVRGNAPPDPKFCPGSAEEYPDFRIVNCNDCAASLALMGKIVGVPLEYYFHLGFGYLNYVEPIGRGKGNNPVCGCEGIASYPPDEERSGFKYHTYTKLPSGNNCDACLKEWVSPLTRLSLLFLWLLILIVSMGTLNVQSLLDRAYGWLVDLGQDEYEAITIDTSTPFEAAAAGGAPSLQPLQFQVT